MLKVARKPLISTGILILSPERLNVTYKTATQLKATLMLESMGKRRELLHVL